MVTDKALWLAEYLYNHKRATLAQISEAWEYSPMNKPKRKPKGKERKGTEPMNRRTFQETRKKVEALFDTIILCDPITHEYYYDYPDSFNDNKVHGWLFKTFSLTTILQKYKGLKEQIFLEEPATGNEHIQDILEAIQQSLKVEMCYKPFDKDSYKTTLSAYCLKAFKKRWYVLGFSSRHNEIRTFALDRVESIALTAENFEDPADYEYIAHFKDCYGVNYGVKPYTIEFRVEPYERPYLRTSPIHHSQKEIEEGVFQIYTNPSYALKQEFLSYGSGIEIISPASFKDEMKQEIEKMLKIYGE